MRLILRPPTRDAHTTNNNNSPPKPQTDLTYNDIMAADDDDTNTHADPAYGFLPWEALAFDKARICSPRVSASVSTCVPARPIGRPGLCLLSVCLSGILAPRLYLLITCTRHPTQLGSRSRNSSPCPAASTSPPFWYANVLRIHVCVCIHQPTKPSRS